MTETTIPKVDDFTITGAGDASAWALAAWHRLQGVSPEAAPYTTDFKCVYSANGIYFLVYNEDTHLSCTRRDDFDDLFWEDVVEVFLLPDPAYALYFEYEISPLGAELPILVSNRNGQFMGWRPWHYEKERRVSRQTRVFGGEKAPDSRVDGWQTEFFFPFALFRGVIAENPSEGTEWYGNVYRIDHDHQDARQWAWCPDTGPNFHDYHNFGKIRFGPKES